MSADVRRISWYDQTLKYSNRQRWDEHKRGLRLLNPFENDEKGLSEAEVKARLSRFPQGTVGAVALDKHGMLACATSTGGKTNKNSRCIR